MKEQYQPILDLFKPQFKDGDLNPQLRSEDALKSIPGETLDLLKTQRQDRHFYFKSGLEKNSNPQKPKSLYSLLLYPQKYPIPILYYCIFFDLKTPDMIKLS